MKKIFYKIFFILIIVTYMPLIIIYGFNSLYVNEYIKKKKAKDLKEITEFVNINSFSLKYKKKIEETEDIKIDIIDLTSDKPKTYIFEYLNKRDLKIDIEHMKINESIVKFVKRTNLLNNIYIIKKVDKEKFIVISSLMVVPEVISHIILSAYFYVTALIIPVLFILTYFISKKMSKPIELLEEVSKKMSNLDFSKKIEFKSDDELTRLGKNTGSGTTTRERIGIGRENDSNRSFTKNRRCYSIDVAVDCCGRKCVGKCERLETKRRKIKSREKSF